MFYNFRITVCVLMALSCMSLQAHDVLIEAKGAYFLSTNHLFKDIYNNGGGRYGGELTVKLYKHLYGFASADFLSKRGRSIGCCSPTKVNLINLGLGLKYMIPFCYGDFYVGLGVLPTHLRTKDCSAFVIPKRSKWGCGGIGKIGTYFNLSPHVLVDIFVDYSFVKIPFKCRSNQPTQSHTANLSGCGFGAGFGYRFN